ncbi:hypothetical protein SDC9_151335 [bioreactor metagenome]|uniref:Uncharacterized protein n=1 Tax=bioreactor metagenome TaxID=1076179 RepID=A0A645ESD6_9ZZZZ
MRIAPFFEHTDVHFNALHIGIHRFVLQVADLHLLATLQYHDLFVVEVHHVLGVFNQRGGIRSYKEFFVVFTQTNDQRTAFTCRNDLVGVVFIDQHNGVCTNHPIQRQANRRHGIYFVTLFDVFDELYQHFGIRFTLECKSMFQ